MHVLTYHRFRHAPRDPFSVTPEAFARQMAWLAEQRLAISLTRFRQHIEACQPLPRDAVLVTIDDGYRDLYTHGLPILRRYQIPAVSFVTVGRIEERSGPPPAHCEDDTHLSWSEVAELAANGVTVASHGWDHVSLASLDAPQLAFQLRYSRGELESRLGTAVDAFAYPFGTRRDFGPATERALADAGYMLGFTAQHGAVRLGANPLALPRVKVEGGEGLWMFRQISRGHLDALGVVDFLFSRIQARGEADSVPVRGDLGTDSKAVGYAGD